MYIALKVTVQCLFIPRKSLQKVPWMCTTATNANMIATFIEWAFDCMFWKTTFGLLQNLFIHISYIIGWFTESIMFGKFLNGVVRRCSTFGGQTCFGSNSQIIEPNPNSHLFCDKEVIMMLPKWETGCPTFFRKPKRKGLLYAMLPIGGNCDWNWTLLGVEKETKVGIKLSNMSGSLLAAPLPLTSIHWWFGTFLSSCTCSKFASSKAKIFFHT